MTKIVIKALSIDDFFLQFLFDPQPGREVKRTYQTEQIIDLETQRKTARGGEGE